MKTTVSETDKRTVQGGLDFEQRLRPLRKPIYQRAMRMLGNSADAEDITQETFLRAWSYWERYEPSRSIEAWVFRIAHNLCIDSVRRRRRRPEYSLDTSTWKGTEGEAAAHEVVDRSQDPQSLLMAQVSEADLRRSIETLPHAYRACVHLLEHDFSYEEIARQLDCPVGTVRSRVHRARGYLRRALACDPQPLGSV